MSGNNSVVFGGIYLFRNISILLWLNLQYLSGNNVLLFYGWIYLSGNISILLWLNIPVREYFHTFMVEFTCLLRGSDQPCSRQSQSPVGCSPCNKYKKWCTYLGHCKYVSMPTFYCLKGQYKRFFYLQCLGSQPIEQVKIF